jgi:hypothetical protein
MTTIAASRSGQLARPGARLVELEEAIIVVPRAYERIASTPSTGPSPGTDCVDDTSAREIRWACEWWPPTE